MRRPSWDPAQYQEAHSFAWENACALLELMDPKPGERILDLGSRTGQLTARIAAFGAEVVGIDSSETMIDAARANYPTVRFVCGDARNYSSEQRFDAIFSNAALHWVSPAEQAALAISRHLNPGTGFSPIWRTEQHRFYS